MAFSSFDDLARSARKRVAVVEDHIILRSERDRGGARTSTVVRMGRLVIQQLGWTPGQDRVELLLDAAGRKLMMRKIDPGRKHGYKLFGKAQGNAFVKYTVAPGMPVSFTPVAVQPKDFSVVNGSVVLTLADEVTFAQ